MDYEDVCDSPRRVASYIDSDLGPVRYQLIDPVFAKDYERTARALGIAASIVEQQGDKHRRKGSRNDKD